MGRQVVAVQKLLRGLVRYMYMLQQSPCTKEAASGITHRAPGGRERSKLFSCQPIGLSLPLDRLH